MRALAFGAWGILNRPLPESVVLFLVAMFFAGACSVLFLMTLANTPMARVVWAVILVFLGFHRYHVRLRGGRRSRRTKDPIKRTHVERNEIVIHRAFRSTAIPIGLVVMPGIVFFCLLGSIVLRSWLGVSAWGLLFAMLVSPLILILFQPPRSGPPPSPPPPNLSPAGTPVLPVFPDAVLIGADEKELPIERVARL